MLIAACSAQERNRRHLEAASRMDRLVVGIQIDRSRLLIETVRWAGFWRPAARYLGADARLVHRLNCLRRAWHDVLRHPGRRRAQALSCRRYFGPLHHTLWTTRREPRRGDPLPALRRILGFEAFTIERAGQDVRAAGLSTNRNPVYLLGRLPANAPLPSPRHVPLLLPANETQPFYHYRQLLWRNSSRLGLLVSPSTDLKKRPASFGVIDRFVGLLTRRPDPYWRARGRVLSRRVFAVLLALWMEKPQARASSTELRVLDVGAGTGRLMLEAWRDARRSRRGTAHLEVCIHCVDAAEPCVGRSVGLGGRITDLASVEWSTADYRKLLDDDTWLAAHGPFDWAVLSRLLDNASNFSIEAVPLPKGETHNHDTCCPCLCLAPRDQHQGFHQLAVTVQKRRARSGTSMLQLSLCDYFAAMRAVMTGTIETCSTNAGLLPIRRFNPASLTTYTGRSVVGQLMKAARAIVIEDVDLMPDDLLQHKERFGLEGTAAIHLKGDGCTTVALQYVVCNPAWADRFQGHRLW